MNMVDFSTMDGLQVLVYLLTHKEGIFLWYMIGFGFFIMALNFYLDRKDDTTKHINPNDQYH